MERFFFHVQNGMHLTDDLGIELLGIEQARQEALRLTVDLLGANSEKFWNGEKWRVTVAAPKDNVLFSVVFSATFEAKPISENSE